MPEQACPYNTLEAKCWCGVFHAVLHITSPTGSIYKGQTAQEATVKQHYVQCRASNCGTAQSSTGSRHRHHFVKS